MTEHDFEPLVALPSQVLFAFGPLPHLQTPFTHCDDVWHALPCLVDCAVVSAMHASSAALHAALPTGASMLLMQEGLSSLVEPSVGSVASAPQARSHAALVIITPNVGKSNFMRLVLSL
jgi:hypothetical protein